MTSGVKMLSAVLMVLLCSICTYAQEEKGQTKSFEELKKLEMQLYEKQSRIQRDRYLLIGSGILILLGVGFYLKISRQREEEQRRNLLQQIDEYKGKLNVQSATPIQKSEDLKLDKSKIEKTINAKLGESSWIILNLICQNPSISNQEIANKVSLSLEGVSSSLRRMYAAFDIKSANNKKVTLIMKALRTSSGE